MSIIVTTSNHAKFMMATGQIDLSTDTIKAILLNSSFVFDKDAHATISHADITSYQLATNEYGYTQNNKTVSVLSTEENDTTDRGTVNFNNIVWTASGGSIGPFNQMLFYDDSTSDDTVLAHILFDTTYTITDGSVFSPQTIRISIL